LKGRENKEGLRGKSKHAERMKEEKRNLAQPAVPQTVTIVNQKLPDMKEGEEIETFLGMFEAALRASNVPANQWCAKLHAHLNPSTKLRIQETIQNPDATYEVIREALLGCGSIPSVQLLSHSCLGTGVSCTLYHNNVKRSCTS